MGIFYLQYVCIYNIKTKCKCYVTCLVPISQALFSLGPDSTEYLFTVKVIVEAFKKFYKH